MMGDSVPCRACGESALVLILDLGEMPLAGGFLSGPEAIEAEQRYPLRIYVCGDCALVQIVDVIDPDILFQDYSFSSSTIPALVEHFRGYAQWIHDRFEPKRVVEFGCNDGILLEPLAEFGIDAWGVDVSQNITDDGPLEGSSGALRDSSPFDGRRDTRSRGTGGHRYGSNAFAHNEDPVPILAAARSVLDAGRPSLSRSHVRGGSARAGAVGHALPRASHVLLAGNATRSCWSATASLSYTQSGFRCTADRCESPPHWLPASPPTRFARSTGTSS